MSGKILILGEFLSGKDEKGAFTDGNGRFLRAMLHKVGISPRDCVFRNVLNTRPPGGIKGVLGPKSEGIKHMKPVGGKYVNARWEPNVRALWEEINALQPSIILAAGDIAMWAVTSETSIDAARGRVAPCHSGLPGLKALPTYRPSVANIDPKQRPVFYYDLLKLERESKVEGFHRPQRLIHIAQTLEDLEDFYNEHIADCEYLSVDIEVKGYKERAHSITCISFSPTPYLSLVIPFFTEEKKDGNYWDTPVQEVRAWKFVARVLRSGKKIGGQNYQYDSQYLWRLVGIPNPDFQWDTMLMHHALEPELSKGLGFLASLYLDEPSWKGMHKTSASDKSVKKGDD